jgi:hypothetical protein
MLVLEYSPTQKVFHIQELSDRLKLSNNDDWPILCMSRDRNKLHDISFAMNGHRLDSIEAMCELMVQKVCADEY